MDAGMGGRKEWKNGRKAGMIGGGWMNENVEGRKKRRLSLLVFLLCIISSYIFIILSECISGDPGSRVSPHLGGFIKTKPHTYNPGARG